MNDENEVSREKKSISPTFFTWHAQKCNFYGSALSALFKSLRKFTQTKRFRWHWKIIKSFSFSETEFSPFFFALERLINLRETNKALVLALRNKNFHIQLKIIEWRENLACFQARSHSKQLYNVLWNISTAQTINNLMLSSFFVEWVAKRKNIFPSRFSLDFLSFNNNWSFHEARKECSSGVCVAICMSIMIPAPSCYCWVKWIIKSSSNHALNRRRF